MQIKELTDEELNQLYPSSIQALAKRHWTPLWVAEKAASFLSAGNSSSRILDIGSGVGKFCLAAAYYTPDAFYYGVEQRKDLVAYAKAGAKALQLTNVSFMASNFTRLDFNNFDHFYFYNSFYENLNGTEKIDLHIAYSEELYNYYNRYLYRQLEQRPPGTRLVTYHSLEDEIPEGYRQAVPPTDHFLKYWIKV